MSSSSTISNASNLRRLCCWRCSSCNYLASLKTNRLIRVQVVLPVLLFLKEKNMYRLLFFTDSKVLDKLAPYVLVFSSDKVEYNALLITIILVVIFSICSSLLSFITLVLGSFYILFTSILRLYFLNRLLIKKELGN
ncbi:immunity protein BlpZ [Streptococcus pluranimalium]|uniref:immunity protein BlpZ n=1 Tax=Streptococcus pluranimalium TaxID=82348 RepID=UPI0039FBA34D